MLSSQTKNYFHLHILVLIAGFTAILGHLISLDALQLVWFRMVFAIVFMLGAILVTKQSLKVSTKLLGQFFLGGCVVALHWVFFFASIKQANISIALSTFAAGAFFGSFIEPMFYKRKIRAYEIVLGLVVLWGVILITNSQLHYMVGVIYGLLSALFGALFTVINGVLVQKSKPKVISIYEFIFGTVLLSVLLGIQNDNLNELLVIQKIDFIYLLILASICTAYPFIASVHIMRKIKPYSVILAYNLEPIYGIGLGALFFPDNEKMSPLFYLGCILIITTVFVDAKIKYKRKQSLS